MVRHGWSVVGMVAALAAIILFGDAGAFAQCPGGVYPRVERVVNRAVSVPVEVTRSSLAYTKSVAQATAGAVFHPGGGFGGGNFEGVGFSSRSPQEALNSCCKPRGRYRIIDQSVVRGPRGWHATRIYQRY